MRTRRRACTGKIRFRSLRDALASRKEGRLWELSVYRCIYCRHFHLGHLMLDRPALRPKLPPAEVLPS